MKPRGQSKINAAKTACKYGHRLDGENVHLVARPDRGEGVEHRHCRECHLRVSRESWRRLHSKRQP